MRDGRRETGDGSRRCSSRREFVSALGASAVYSRLPSPGHSTTGRISRIGVQLYTVRTLMQRDFEGTLARVAQVGYREVEFAGYFDRTPQQVRAALRANRLAAPAVHIGMDLLETPGWRPALDAAAVIGHEYMVVAWTPAERRRSLDDWRRIGDLYTRKAREAQAAGLKFAYHNHSYEFVEMEGRIPYDVLLESTDPALVKLEMDLYWITEGRQDPLVYFARNPGRIHLVHIKDMTADRRMVDVGAGSIDWHAILSKHAQAGIRHYFVEHDEPADAIASITASYQYLRRLEI